MEGTSRKKTAEITGYKYTYLTKLVTKYLTGGIEAIVENHYPGNRRYMDYQEEEEFLERFRKEAESGQIVEVSRIKEAYDEAGFGRINKPKYCWCPSINSASSY